MWNETSSRPRHFSYTKLFTFPTIFIPSENSPVDSLSSSFCVSNPLLPSQTLLTVIFKLPCMCCLSVRSFFPPAPVWKRSARCLWSLCDGGHHQSKRREKEMRGGRQCLSCVCGVWGTLQCLFSVLYDAACWMRDWFIVLFSRCPGRSRCWLNRDGENICTSKAICVYYGLFHYVYGGVSGHFCSDNLHLEQIAYLNFVWIAFIAFCTLCKQDAIFLAIYIWCTACTCSV